MSIVGSLSFNNPTHLQPTEERYLTSPITVAAMLIALRRSGYTPPPGPIVDPCACGYGGFSVGAMAAAFWGREADLTDLVPLGPDVREADATRRSYAGAGLVITNPAFTIADEIRAAALAAGADVCLMRPLMAFFDAGRSSHLDTLVTHDWRQGFGLTFDDATRLRAIRDAWDGEGKAPLKVIDRSDSISGYGLASDGRHHAWGLDTATPSDGHFKGVVATRDHFAAHRSAPAFARARDVLPEHMTHPQLALF